MRLARHLVYFGFLGGTAVLCWDPVSTLLEVLSCRLCYFPFLPTPWYWSAVALLWLGYTVFFLVAAVRGKSLSLMHHAAVLLIFGAAVMGRIYGDVGVEEQPAEAPPAWQLSLAASGLHAELRSRVEHGLSLPAEAAEIEELLRDSSGELPRSGFRSHGVATPIRVRAVRDAQGPILDMANDTPGTIVYAVSADRRRYWLSLVGSDRAPRAEPAVMLDEHGAAFVLSAGAQEVGP